MLYFTQIHSILINIYKKIYFNDIKLQRCTHFTSYSQAPIWKTKICHRECVFGIFCNIFHAYVCTYHVCTIRDYWSGKMMILILFLEIFKFNFDVLHSMKLLQFSLPHIKFQWNWNKIHFYHMTMNFIIDSSGQNKKKKFEIN